MSERVIPAAFRREIEKQESAEIALIFLTIRHPKIIGGINVVSDPENYILDGVEYQGFEFELTHLSDGDGPPKATLNVQNVDRLIGEAVRTAIDAVKLEIQFIAGSQFDESEFPRIAIDDPVERVVHVRHAELIDVEGDDFFLSGTIQTVDYTQETYPGIRATEDRTPGLFW